MLDFLPKDCLDNILSHLFQGIYIQYWEDVLPFTTHEWSKLRDPLNKFRAHHYNNNIIGLFNIEKILKMAKGRTREGDSLPLGITNFSRNYINNIGDIILDWKEKKRIDCPNTAELIMRYKWKPSPYYISLNFMNTCKVLRDTYNTETFWNTMYAEHYRYGKKYVRVPPNIKSLYREKVKDTIFLRYKPLYDNIVVECERYIEKIKQNTENRNILIDIIKDINTFPIEDIESIPRVLNISIPSSYLSNIEMNSTNSYRITLQQTLLKISKHQDEITSKHDKYKKLRVIQKRLERFFEKM